MKLNIMYPPVIASAFAFTTLLLVMTSTYAQTVIIDEDFEALSVGAEDTVWPYNNGATTPWDDVSGVVDDSSDIFGTGNARYLDVQASGTDIKTVYTFTNTTDLVYIGFDFILDPLHSEVALQIGDLGDISSFVDARIRGAEGPFAADNVISFQGGPTTVTGSITSNTRFRLELVLNNGMSASSYSGVGNIATDQTIAAGSYDIFIRNYAASTTYQLGNDIGQYGTGEIDRVTWINFGNRDIDFALDNVAISAIPEPSSSALLVGFLVLGALDLRCRR